MYGLIHSAIHQLVLDNYGAETWNAILSKAGNPDDAFLTMRSYDDEITFRIVEAVSEVLEVSIGECLEVFGSYWLVKFAPSNYGTLLDYGGNDVAAFLRNLDDMHDHISTSFTEFVPPSFKVDFADKDRILVTYRSQRQGLTPFVRGILSGMKERFNQPFQLTEEIQSTGEDGETTQFHLSFQN